MQPVAPTSKYSIKYYPDSIIKWEREGNFFYFFSKETILEVRVISDRILRFRYAAEGKFQRDFSYGLNAPIRESIIFLEIQQRESSFLIRTDLLEVHISSENLKISVFDRAGNLINEDEKGFHWQYYLLKGGKIVYCSKKIQAGESFFGLGDKPSDLNLRGKRLENYGADKYGYAKETDPLYKNIPFYLGLNQGIGYGIFFDNTFRTLFDFGQERPEVASFWARGGEMNYYFIYGPGLLQVSEAYTKLTGLPDLPPLWALGYHQSRWSYYPDTKALEIAREFRSRKIPCDVIHLDIDYMEGFRCFTFSREGFPDPSRLFRELQEMGFKAVVIIDPGIKVDPEYRIYQEGVSKNYFCKRGDGALMEGDVWPGKCVFPDFTNPEVRKWWSSLFRALAETGIRGVWNDMNEPAVFEIGTFPEDVRHEFDGDPCSHRKAHNVYGHMMSKATAEGLNKYLMPHRPFLLTRSCYAGAQGWSAVWTGDNTASWEHLNLASLQCQRLSISGISFCGSDIGGFIGEPDGELYIRWLQMAAFHAFMRTHSASNESNFNQEPWSFGHKIEFIARKFLRLRYQLLPYLYTTFWQYAVEGTPMLRPLAFVSQQDPVALTRQDEFMTGDHLLVSPVNEPGMESKEVYLPEGQWYYYWDDQLFQGPGFVRIETPLESIPLFIRAGAVIPAFPPMQFMPERIVIEEMILHVYYGKNITHSILYEDAGDHYGYRRDQCNTIRFKLSADGSRIRVRKKFIGQFDSSYRQFRIIFHGVPFKATEYLLNGKTIRLNSRNFAIGTVKIRVDRAFEEIILQ